MYNTDNIGNSKYFLSDLSGQIAPLAVDWPDELALYKSYFIDFWPRGPYYERRGYDRSWFCKKIKDSDRPLYLFNDDLLGSRVERTLDDRLHGDQPFWFGLNLPTKTRFGMVDLDNKKIITLFPKGKRQTPLVSVPVEHLRRAKVVFDHMRPTVWCVSSQSLGFHCYRKFPQLHDTHRVHASMQLELQEVGLEAEVHPMKGRCMRRPFGCDYVTFTAKNTLRAWQGQIQFFHEPEAITWDDLLR